MAVRGRDPRASPRQLRSLPPTVKVPPSPCSLHCSRAVFASYNLLLLHSNRPCYFQRLCPQPHPPTARVVSQSWGLPVSSHTPLPTVLESRCPGDEAQLLSRGVSPSSCSSCSPRPPPTPNTHTLCLGLSTLVSGDSVSSTIVQHHPSRPLLYSPLGLPPLLHLSPQNSVVIKSTG